jgi:D-alanyl-lipoteichoic acid acyltransferase DltB (MBOAT superfamily)
MTASLLDVRFLLLLTLVGLGRFVWPQRHYALFGTLASAGLISLASPATALTIIGLTTCYLFPLHRLMRRIQTRQNARPLLWVGIGGLVGLLVIFKLYQNFDLPIFGASWLRAELVSLVGFSYFLFRAIQFLHIQSITDVDERTPWSLLFFLLFPPTLTSGPIQKFQDFREQVREPQALSTALVWSAAYRITRGLFRKLVLAASLNSLVELLLATSSLNAYMSLLLIAALYLYFYFDFAGYSDIAIGFGALLGIRVPENFRNPFLAASVTEFWRNWHITLVDWFRDQVFIPLGGMSSGRLRSGALAFVIMILCGLWHGLTWSFVLWGLWHGSLLTAEALSGTKPLPRSLRHGWRYWSRVAWTNSRVAFASVLFLPDVASSAVLTGLTRWF